MFRPDTKGGFDTRLVLNAGTTPQRGAIGRYLWDFRSWVSGPRKALHALFSEPFNSSETVMRLHSILLMALVLSIGGTVPSIAEEGPNKVFTCTAKTFNECLMEAPCSAWKRSGPKAYKLDTKIIFRGNPLQGEVISGGTIGDALETKCGTK
jgi:hypothetical protein